MIVGLFIMLVFFNSQNFINGIKESDNLFLPNFYIFSPLHLQFHILGFYWHNLRTINEATLSNNQILKFLFLIYDFGKFPLLLNLIIVLSPLVRWQSSMLFESQITSISPKISSPKVRSFEFSKYILEEWE